MEPGYRDASVVIAEMIEFLLASKPGIAGDPEPICASLDRVISPTGNDEPLRKAIALMKSAIRSACTLHAEITALEAHVNQAIATAAAFGEPS